MGYDVTACDDGTTGLAQLRAQDPDFDLIITDILMKRMDGPDMLKTAKHDGLVSCPVLFITGFGHEYLGDLLDDPGIFVLRKPFNRGDLSRTLDEILHAAI